MSSRRPYISHKQAFCKGFQDGSEGRGPYPDLPNIDSEWVRDWPSYREGYRKGEEFVENDGWGPEEEKSDKSSDFWGAIVGIGALGLVAWSIISGSKKQYD